MYKIDKQQLPTLWTSQVVLVVKKLPASAGDIRDMGLISGSGRSPEGEHGSPLQYCCLENSMEREAWWDTVHWLIKIQLKQLSTQTCTHCQHRELCSIFCNNP